MKLRRKISFGKILLWLFVGFILAFLLLPSILVVPMSFSNTDYLKFPPEGFTMHWHFKFFTDSRWVEPTLFSLEVAFFTTLVSLVIGTMASLGMVRGVMPGKRILHIFFISPMIVPIIVTAFAVYGIFAKLRLIGTTIGMVLAHSLICIPYVVLVTTANLYRFDLSLEMAARNLGASAIKTFFRITLPIIKPAILASGIFCFIISLDDLVLALFLAGSTRMTLPLRMFSDIQFSIDPVIAAASTVFIAVAIFTIFFLSLTRK